VVDGSFRQLRIVPVQHQRFGMQHMVADVGLRRNGFTMACLAVWIQDRPARGLRMARRSGEVDATASTLHNVAGISVANIRDLFRWLQAISQRSFALQGRYVTLSHTTACPRSIFGPHVPSRRCLVGGGSGHRPEPQ
jgi:hypothetical protein